MDTCGLRGVSEYRPGAGIGAAERSARRILVVDSALLILLVLAVHLAFVVQGREGDYPLWSIALGWASASVTVFAGICARRAPDRTLGRLAVAAVVGYGLTIVTFPAAVPVEGIDRIPWTLSASGAAVAAALVAGGRSLGWATVIVGAAAGLVYRTVYGGLDLDGVVNDLQALLTGAVICVIGGHILAVGRGLDIAASSTMVAAALESAEKGRLAASTTAAALVHDEVLATLSLAASGLPVPRRRLAAQAQAAAEMVTRLADADSHEPLSVGAALAAEARRYGASFSEDSAGEGGTGAPTGITRADVRSALIGATRQALHNSSQHAPDAARRVVLRTSASEIDVEISDDGHGFDPARIADDRLGIRQSIVARMAGLDGGSAEIHSAPGRGAVIRLRYAPSSPTGKADPAGATSLRVPVRVVTVLFLAVQAACAVLGALVLPGSWLLQLAMLVIVLVASEFLRASPHRMPSRRRTAVVVVVATTGMVGGIAVALGVYGMTFSYGSMWFAVAMAFLFVAVALRRRIGMALAGAAMIVLSLVLAGVLVGAAPGIILQVSVRPVVLVGLAVALLIVVERMQRRTACLHAEAVASAEKQSWTSAARTELNARVTELARTAVPLLHRISEGAESTESERNEYASCEGELRDNLRAGVLAREPLASVVAAARARGVDVVLLDDSGGAVDENLIDPILRWMAAAIATSRLKAVGRLTPAGRNSCASLTVDAQHVEFLRSAVQEHPPVAAQGAVMSFHGE